MALAAALLAACEATPALPPNPFRMPPTRVVDLPQPTAVAADPTERPAPFSPYWVKNHRQTEMWSGQVGEPDVVSFGVTSDQFCVFRVLLPQNGPRLLVLNPFGGGQFWIDGDAVGPVSEEPHRVASSAPGDQNCAGVIYDGRGATLERPASASANETARHPAGRLHHQRNSAFRSARTISEARP